MPSRMIPRTFTQQLTLLLCSAFAAGALVWWWFSADKIQRLMSHQIALRAQVQAVQLAQYPDLIEAVNKRDAKQVSQLVQALQSVTDADFITVSDRQGIRLAHPITARIGLPVMGDDIRPALDEGKAYLSYSVGSMGPSLRYISPIRAANGDVIGMIKVGYLLDTVAVWQNEKLQPLLLVAGITLLLATLISTAFARLVRRQMQDREPWQLAQSLMTYEGVIQATHEGLVAINPNGDIYLINDSAKRLLGVESEQLSVIATWLQGISEQEKHETYIDRLACLNGQSLIVSCVPLWDKHGAAGAVFSLRAHSELQALADRLQQVDQYVDSVRMARHEYRNKLSTLAGLLQLQHYDQALHYVLQQSNLNQVQMDALRHLHAWPQLTAILMGKWSKGQEWHIPLDYSAVESVTSLGMAEESFCTLVGNLIDNSLEAVRGTPAPWVRVSLHQNGRELCLRVSNNGPQVTQALTELCKPGVTSKQGEGERGIGLYLVQSLVSRAQGHLELDSDQHETTFSLYIPKE
ncbi:sensor histidine kinase [Vibrio cholerae]|uniref:ATP-binding protein n=1 Tax=Vibrio cholerae TaxID=666 RepID=UPI000E0A2D9E|nr:sensor histidine kinase [Vibrio cholerae]ELJ8535924.1 sensor histidine kinase [Vibrio cholerae]ELJ8576283.1 sensor histidine kinase [Vibrio cholerae]MCQ0982940.1 sensor histidine kinase [Vibrio cholerae]MCR9872588.1 sensor histidine kinase [Vibrio cholerae]GIA12563.1 histidine kinase-, DNA gyrase B-, and HSP90-like ATPase family protein [Vibrio cholerae]